MPLQTMNPGTYPVPFTWSNCGSTAGADTITHDWQSLSLNTMNDDCPSVWRGGETEARDACA